MILLNKGKSETIRILYNKWNRDISRRLSLLIGDILLARKLVVKENDEKNILKTITTALPIIIPDGIKLSNTFCTFLTFSYPEYLYNIYLSF